MWGMRDGILSSLGPRFTINEKIDIPKVRKLTIELANDLIKRVNNSKKLRPYLKNYPQIHFNCSHSEELILIGITDSCQIGVDIELIKTRSDENDIAKNFFSFDEYTCYKFHRHYH